MTGARIRAAREAGGFTQPDVADPLGHSAKWLSEIERGVNSLDVHDLKAIADFLGYPVDWFLDEEYRGGAFTPKTRLDWEMIFPESKIRARMHADLDHVIVRGEEHGALDSHVKARGEQTLN